MVKGFWIWNFRPPNVEREASCTAGDTIILLILEVEKNFPLLRDPGRTNAAIQKLNKPRGGLF
jgi:hypothetical protein